MVDEREHPRKRAQAPPQARRPRRRPPEDEEPPGAPDWVVTFTDMVSLLVTFFVLLMTFSSMSELDVMQVRGVLDGKNGMLESGTGPRSIDPPKDDLISDTDPLKGALTPHSRPETEDFDRDDAGTRDDRPQFDLTEIEDGLLLEFGPEESFAPGSAALPPALGARLDSLAEVLTHYPHQIVLEGHVSAAFRPTAEFADAHALSVARAVAAAARLTARGLDPTRVQVVGQGADRPRGAGDAAADRRLDRRVELRVVSLPAARAGGLGGGGR